jgi:hypothetical protein
VPVPTLVQSACARARARTCGLLEVGAVGVGGGLGEHGVEALERRDHRGWHHGAAATRMHHRVVGAKADDRHRLAGGERQQLALVLEQHRALRGELARGLDRGLGGDVVAELLVGPGGGVWPRPLRLGIS